MDDWSRSSRVSRPRARVAGAEYSSSARASPIRPRASSQVSSRPALIWSRQSSARVSDANAERGKSRSRRRKSRTPPGLDDALRQAEVGLVAPAGPKEQHEAAVVNFVEGDGGELAGHHVGTLEAASESEEEPRLVPAHHGVGQAHHAGALGLDEGQVGSRPGLAAGLPLHGQLGPGRVDVLPELDRDHVAHGSRVLARAASAPAMEDRLWGSVASRSVACHSVSVPLSGSPITASSRRAEADPSTSLCSRAWYTDTSRIRAVPSARST